MWADQKVAVKVRKKSGLNHWRTCLILQYGPLPIDALCQWWHLCGDGFVTGVYLHLSIWLARWRYMQYRDAVDLLSQLAPADPRSPLHHSRLGAPGHSRRIQCGVSPTSGANDMDAPMWRKKSAEMALDLVHRRAAVRGVNNCQWSVSLVFRRCTLFTSLCRQVVIPFPCRFYSELHHGGCRRLLVSLPCYFLFLYSSFLL